MTDLKEILFVCSLLFFFFALVTVWALIASVFELIFKRKKIDWSMFNLADFFRSAFSEKHSMTGKIVYGIVLPAAIVAGGVNAALWHFCSKPEVGAFYEQGTYKQNYASWLDTGTSSIFCIATVSKYEGYTIVNIRLPYGREDSGDSEYDPQKNVARVYMGPEGVDCDLSLDHVATAMDYEFLRTYTITNYGEFCASRRGDTYHFSDCPYVNQIKPENLIYFNSCNDAMALGFEPCGFCGG